MKKKSSKPQHVQQVRRRVSYVSKKVAEQRRGITAAIGTVWEVLDRQEPTDPGDVAYRRQHTVIFYKAHPDHPFHPTRRIELPYHPDHERFFNVFTDAEREAYFRTYSRRMYRAVEKWQAETGHAVYVPQDAEEP